MSFTVAIVGRPNVGKSTLFNRLVGRRLALVDDRPGVTRDRREGEARLGDLEFTIIDTAGLEESAPESLSGRMRAQTETAIGQADAIFFMIDTRAGPTPDRPRLRRRSCAAPASRRVLVANKSEGRAGRGAAAARPTRSASASRWRSRPSTARAWSISTTRWCAALPEQTAAQRDEAEAETRGPHPIRVAIVGRPNAGKSTLINRLIGEERLLTGPEAGITRDSIAVDLDWHGRPFRLFDTAGLRRQLARRGEAGEAVGRRRAQRDPLRRSGGGADRRRQRLRGAGPAHRRPGRAGGPRARHRASTNGI